MYLVKHKTAGAKTSNDGAAHEPLLIREPPPTVHHGGRVRQPDAATEQKRVAKHKRRQVGCEGGEEDSERHDDATQCGCCLR